MTDEEQGRVIEALYEFEAEDGRSLLEDLLPNVVASY